MNLPPIIRLRVIMAIILVLPSLLHAQTAKRDVRHGNMLMRDSLPSEADVWYRRALQREPHNPYASLNLGLALFAQQKAPEAHDLFKVAARNASTNSLKNKAFYNAGVALQSQNKLDEAIAAYKDALRLNPNDEEARYNLAVCKRKKQQQNDNQQNNKSKPKPNQKQGQNQNNSSDQSDNKDKGQQGQQPNQSQMSKEEADRLLNVSRQQDREIQERLKKQGKPTSRSKAKYW